MKRRTLITTAIVGALSLGLLATAPVLAKGPGYGGGRGPMMFDRFDTDGDGKVTQQEFDAGHSGRFAQMDINGDGAVTQDEARQAMQQMRAEHMGKGGMGGPGGQGTGRGMGPCGGGMGPGQGQTTQ
jgi:hypothetical protein